MSDALAMELLERIAVGVERLADDPVVQFETFIPECPHCRRVNPIVLVKESEMAGHIGEVVLDVTCQACSNPFIVIPMMMQCVRTVEEAREIQQEREALLAERAEQN